MSTDINSRNSFVRGFYALLNVVAETSTVHLALRPCPEVEDPLPSSYVRLPRSRGFSRRGCGWQPTTCKFLTNPSVPHQEPNLVECIILVSIEYCDSLQTATSVFQFQTGVLMQVRRKFAPARSYPRGVTGYGIRSCWHSAHRAASACLYVQVGGHTVLPLQTSSSGQRVLRTKFCGELAALLSVLCKLN